MRFNSNGGKIKDILARIAEATQPAVERIRRARRKKDDSHDGRRHSQRRANPHSSTVFTAARWSRPPTVPALPAPNTWVKLGPYLEMHGHARHAAAAHGRPEERDSCWRIWARFAIKLWTRRSLPAGFCSCLIELNPEATARALQAGRTCPAREPHELLEAACRGRGWLLTGGTISTWIALRR